MRLFSRPSPAVFALETQAGAVGFAYARVATGKMPADFIDFVLDSDRCARLAQLCLDAAQEVGADKAHSVARPAAESTATIALEVAGRPALQVAKNAVDAVESAIRGSSVGSAKTRG